MATDKGSSDTGTKKTLTDPTSPYYLTSGDNPGIVVTPVQLKGYNYDERGRLCVMPSERRRSSVSLKARFPNLLQTTHQNLKIHRLEFHYTRTSDEHVPLSSNQAAAPASSGGLPVDTNLDALTPDTYRPPPAPIPFNATLTVSQTSPVAQEIYSIRTNGSLHSKNSNSVQETVSGDNHGILAKLEELKESERKIEADLELNPAKCSENQLPKLAKHIILEEEDGCPICLEEYDAENPKLTAKCDHHFHLACILEWMERSETCPVCGQDMVFNPPIEL